MSPSLGTRARHKRKELSPKSDENAGATKNDGNTCKRVKFDVNTATTFLSIPREIRQKILLQTISDDDLLPAAALKVIKHKVDKGGRLRKGKAECSIIPAIPNWAQALNFAKHPWKWNTEKKGLTWAGQLEAVHPAIYQDMEWVKNQWLNRIEELGRKKAEGWKMLVGER